MYSLLLEKEYFHFCSAHFVIFDGTKREELHGHNYYVSMQLDGTELNIGKLIDISGLKKELRTICDSLDHKLLLPNSNPHLTLSKKGKNLKVNYNDSEFSFPLSDVLILEMNNTTMENLAHLILNRCIENYPTLKKMTKIKVKVRETMGQSSTFIKNF